MANATYLHARITAQQSQNTTTLTTKQTVSNTDLSNAGFANNDEVLVLWYFKVSHSTTNETRVDLTYNTATIMSGTTTRLDLGASGRERAFMFMGRVSLGTLASFEVKLADSTTTSAYLEKSELLIIKLADFGVENTDWFWNKSTTVTQNTTTYSGTNRAIITWTPSSVEDWIYFAYVHHAIDSASVNAEGRVVLDGSLNSGDWSIEGESTTEEIPVTWFAVLSSLSASEHTLSMQTRDDTTTAANDHRESAIFLFRKAKWTDIYTNIAGTVAVANGSDVQVATITNTLTVSQPLIIWGQGNMNLDTVDTQAYMWIRRDESTVIDPLGNTATGLASGYAYDATDEVPLSVFGYISSESGAQDIDLFASQTNTASRNLLGTGLLVWGMAKKDTYRGYAQGQAHVKVLGLQSYAQSEAYVKITNNAYAQAQTEIALPSATYTEYAQAQSHISRTEQSPAQAEAQIKAVYLSWAQGNSYIKVTGLQSYAQAQSRINRTEQGYAQAQTAIKAIYQVYANAQAQIKQSYLAHAQAQSQIKQTYQVYGQAQAQIKINYLQFAQSIAQIKSIYLVVGNSLAQIKQTYAKYAQAIAWIKVGANSVYAQAQAQIKTTSFAYANAQGTVLQTYLSYANAQTQIEQTYQQYAQAQARILAFGVNQFAQAATWIEGSFSQYAQAQAKINAYAVKAYAQAQAQIEQTYQVHAQAQAKIKAASQAYAQAQVQIKTTYRTFGQAQSIVGTANLKYAQAQTYIKGTSLVYANAQAQIKATYAGWAQAQTQIKTTYQGYANAQTSILAGNIVYGQALAQIEATYEVYAQSQALILFTSTVTAQAAAHILNSYSGQGQAQALLIKAAGYGQAQGYVRIVHLLKSMTISDTIAINLTVSDYESETVTSDTGTISITLSEYVLGLTLSDHATPDLIVSDENY